MDDDELTVSSQDSIDDIRRMVAEAQARQAAAGRPVPASDEDDEMTVEADAWVVSQINAGLAAANRVDDGESTWATEPAWGRAAPPPSAPALPPPAPSMKPPAMPPPAPREDVFHVELTPAAIAREAAPEPTRAVTEFSPVDGPKWQPPARLVRPTEPDTPHPHQIARKWKLIAAGLAAVLLVLIVVQAVGMMTGGDQPSDPTTNTVVGDSTVSSSSVLGG